MNDTINKTSETKTEYCSKFVLSVTKARIILQYSLRIFDNYINFRLHMCIIDHHNYSMFYIVSR